MAKRIEGIKALGKLSKNKYQGTKQRRAWVILEHWLQTESTARVYGELDGYIRRWGDIKPREECLDIEYAIRTLCKITANMDRENSFTQLDLRHLNLNNINFKCANFKNSHLQGSNLSNSNLQNTKYSKFAKLQEANLTGSNLQGVDLADANLNRADISSANMKDVKNLTQEQLEKIVYNIEHPPLNLPKGLVLPAHRAYYQTKEMGKYFEESDFPESGEELEYYWLPMERKQEQEA